MEFYRRVRLHRADRGDDERGPLGDRIADARVAHRDDVAHRSDRRGRFASYRFQRAARLFG